MGLTSTIAALARGGSTTLPPGPQLPKYLQSLLYLRYREEFLPALLGADALPAYGGTFASGTRPSLVGVTVTDLTALPWR